MKNIYAGILLGFVLFFVTLNGSAQLLQWNTFGNAGTETIEPSVYNDPNIIGSSLTLGSVTGAANGNRFGGSNWFNTGNTASGNTLAEAIAGNDYIQFVVTPNAGFSFTPTSFVFSWDRSSTGPRSIVLRTSVDGYSSDVGNVAGMPESISSGNTVTISGLANITTSTTFRIYGLGATATSGTGGFDVASSLVNVQLGGTTASISTEEVDYANLQFPGISSITTSGTSNIYAQAYEAGLTEAAGQASGLNAWIGYSTNNQDPATGTWTWVPASFNFQSGNNDEFVATLGPLPTGTYYYASRFQLNGGPFKYGGFSGGFWNGTTNINGILTVDKVDFCNLQTPPSGTSPAGSNFDVYAQVYEPGITPGGGVQGPGIEAWIGYSSTNNNPNSATWTWVPANFNPGGGGPNNDEYSLNLGAVLTTPGTYYYASRFRLNNGAFDYGGILANGTAGSYWDGTTYISGVLTVTGPEINITGNGVNIPDGQTATSTSNNTDFGNLCEALTVSKTFVIQNTGLSSLNIGSMTFSGANPSDFAVSSAPTATIAAGSTTSFQVTFDPDGAGARNATIEIANNDFTENPYSFNLTGTGIAGTTPTVSISITTGSNPLCTGATTVFTAVPAGLGTSTVSTYAWTLNGAAVGGNTDTYSNSNLANNDVVNCSITVTGGCVFNNSATATAITITNNSPVAPVAVSASNTASTSFTANWNAVPGATGYYVDVYYNGPTTDLIISEYVEGSSSNKYIEIYNGTGNSVDLSNYQLRLFSNGQMTSTNTLLSGVLPTGSAIVFRESSATIYGGVSTVAGAAGFNGDDAIALYKISTGNYVDIFGRIGEDPGNAWTSGSFTTIDKTLIRKSSIGSGVNSNPTSGFPTLSTEWDIYPTDFVANLGSHSYFGGLSYVTGYQDIFVNTNSIDITGLSPGLTYYYVVRAFNGLCPSGNSNVMTVPSSGACSASTTIASFLPVTGPVATLVTIKGTGFSTTPASNGVKFGEIFSASYTKYGDTMIIAEVPASVSSSSLIRVANGSTCWGNAASNFTLISTAGSCAMTDLIVSEVFDPASGNDHYIEVFNGTASTINLNSPNNYTMQVINNPSGTVNSFDISGTIAPGQVKVYYAGDNGGLASSPVQGAGVGFNDDDEIRLLKNGAVIDRMLAPDNTGYNWRRLNSVAGPNATYTASEWSLRQELGILSTADIGTFVPASNLDFSTHPSDQTCSFNMSAVGTGTFSAYQWKYYNTSAGTWENVTSGAFPDATIPTGLIPGSPTTSSLSITGNIAAYQDYQFYLEIRNGGACSRASNAAQFKYDTKPMYRSKATGNWTTLGTWEMFDPNSGSWIAVCAYPTSTNSDDVSIKASHVVTLDIDNKIDKLTIDDNAILMAADNSKLEILNSNTGPDFIINGTYIDSANTVNTLNIATNGTWQLGAGATLVRCNSSGSTVYRDHYEGGMNTIPSNGNWIIRYRGDNVSFTSTASTYYPNLTFESYAGAWNPANTVTSSRFSGNSSAPTILGNLDIGGTGSGTVTVYNENRNTTPITVNGSLTVRTGNTLTNMGNNDGTGFDVDGNLVVDGSLLLNSGDTGILKMTGSLMQTMTGTGRVELFDLELNNSNGAVPNLLHALSDSVYNSLSILGTTRLHMSSGNLTLRSSINRTARVATIPSSAGITYASGNFVVERYINTGIGHERSWQFLATPTTGQTIKESWQENGNPTVGYGTRITGPVLGGGLDDETFAHSLKTFNSSTNLWEGISNTTTTQVNNPKGYMLFVRGDRTSMVTPIIQPAAVPTVLRTAGTIHQPSAAPAGISIPANEFASVGNPYASPISLEYMFANNASNLHLAASVWDPSMYGYYAVGGYQTVSSTLNYMPSPGGTGLYPTGTAFKDIQSGQAFFVQAVTSGTGTISFTENVKSSNDRLVNFAPGSTGSSSTVSSFAPVANPRNKQIFRTSLYTSTGAIADGNGVAFDRSYENAIDAHDASKVWNSGENFAMLRDGKWLAVEARAPIEKTDTIFYSMYNLRRQEYQLRFAPQNMQHGNLTAYLVDKYLDNRTQLSLTDSSFVNISINADAASAKPDRFYVVFAQKKIAILSPLPNPKSNETILNENRENITGYLSVYPNPVAGKKMHLQLKDLHPGTYTLELNNQQGQLVFNKILQVNNSIERQLIHLPALLPAGYYQLILRGRNGR